MALHDRSAQEISKAAGPSSTLKMGGRARPSDFCWPAVRRVGAGGAFGPAPPTHMSVQVRSLGTRNLPGDGSWRFGYR
jgi:hypothetical protein